MEFTKDEQYEDSECDSRAERQAMTPEQEQEWREQCLVKPAELDYQNCSKAIEDDRSDETQVKLESFLGRGGGSGGGGEVLIGSALAEGVCSEHEKRNPDSDYQRKLNVERSGCVLGQCRVLLNDLRSWSRKSRDLSLAITHLESVEDRIRRDRADLFGKPY